ncbi:MAG: hypothetical protein WCL18_06215 [bacterium]
MGINTNTFSLALPKKIYISPAQFNTCTLYIVTYCMMSINELLDLEDLITIEMEDEAAVVPE